MSDETLSALVVMRSRSGDIVPGDSVTSANVAGYMPDPAVMQATVDHFSGAGFDVSPPFGISFAISAPRSHFESAFGTELELGNDRGVSTVTTEGGLELPLSALPENIRRNIHAVTFTPPPDFGPTDY